MTNTLPQSPHPGNSSFNYPAGTDARSFQGAHHQPQYIEETPFVSNARYSYQAPFNNSSNQSFGDSPLVTSSSLIGSQYRYDMPVEGQTPLTGSSRPPAPFSQDEVRDDDAQIDLPNLEEARAQRRERRMSSRGTYNDRGEYPGSERRYR